MKKKSVLYLFAKVTLNKGMKCKVLFYVQQASSLAVASLQQEQNNGGSKSPADGAEETVANHVFTEAKTSVLLQTNIATVVNNENPEISIQARIIFDRGMFDS